MSAPILYGPQTGKALLSQYPELGDFEEFKVLNKADLLFAWYVGIQGSPISIELSDNIRFASAAARCFPSNPEKRKLYTNGDFSVDIKAAIKKFGEFSPDARLIAKRMTQNVLEKFQELLNVNVETDFTITRTVGRGDDKIEITEMDWTGRKAYADSAISITKALPDLVKKLEEGFGITEHKKDGETTKTIDRFHQTKSTS